MDFKSYIECIIKPFLSNEEKFCVEAVETPSFDLSFVASIASEDIGRVIGRKGSIAQSIRTMLYALATKEGKKIHLELVEAK